ncbi:MAG: hypothetical protein KAY37_11000 [Phycisphaerae bacterium]|nr:hypothetical protein [Phycisphaerae bacterium]
MTAMQAELDAYVAEVPNCAQRQAGPDPDCAVIAREIMLSHSTTDDVFTRICTGNELLSRVELARRKIRPLVENDKEPLEIELGTADYIFTFAAPFRYPKTSCGFLFRVDLEREHGTNAVATPFDSGGLVRHSRPLDTPTRRRAFLRQHELPVPGYRTYLEATIRVLYVSPWDYVEGKTPEAPGPIDLSDKNVRRWTFEVRFHRQLPLDQHLAAVFVPNAVSTKEWMKAQRVEWKQGGVDIIIFRVPRGGDAWPVLKSRGIAYVREYLEEQRDKQSN